MKYVVSIILALLISGCFSAPKSVLYAGKMVGTFDITAGCETLSLDQDCSQMSGSTRNIEINGTKLRIAGSNDGKIIFLMSMSSFSTDESALDLGSKAIKAYLLEKGIKIISTKVMYGAGKVYGIHYMLDGDGYSQLKALTVKS